jgi:hypothetical protein
MPPKPGPRRGRPNDSMEWVFDNLQLIIVIAGSVAWWLNQRARERAGEKADYDADGKPEVPEARFGDAELAESTRKIREEIRRKIEERRHPGEGQTTTAPKTGQVPTARRYHPAPEPPIVVPRPQVIRTNVRQKAVSQGESRRMADILEEQASLAAKLEQAKQFRAVAQRRVVHEAVMDGPSRSSKLRKDVQQDLRATGALRRAVLLREVLGPPVGLR